MTGSRRASTILTAVLAAALSAPAAAQVEHPGQLEYPPLREFELFEYDRVELENGLVVYLLEDHEIPLVTVQARIRTGSRFDPPEKTGLADLAATVMRTGGAGARSGAEVDRFLEDRAANLSSAMGTAVGSGRLSALKEHLPDAFAVFADVLRRPRFEDDKLAEAKVRQRSAIARRNDSPLSIASREFAKLVYGAESPYGRHTEYATIDAVTRADLEAFHGRYYHPDRVIMGITGDFDRDEMLALVREHFGDWEPGADPRGDDAIDVGALPIRPADPEQVYYIEKTDLTQTSFRVGHLGTTIDDPDYFAAEVMNKIFGEGFASRLFNEIRSERGLAYAIWGGVGANYDYPGVFQVGGQTKLESTAEALNAVVAEIERMKAGGVTDEELAYAKESYLNSFIFNFDTPEEVVGRQMLYEYYGYPDDFLQTFRDRIEAVTAADVERAARRLLHPDRAIILVVGDASRFDRPLSAFGEVVSVDIGIPAAGAEE